MIKHLMVYNNSVHTLVFNLIIGYTALIGLCSILARIIRQSLRRTAALSPAERERELWEMQLW